jgi:hypothetical protein
MPILPETPFSELPTWMNARDLRAWKQLSKADATLLIEAHPHRRIGGVLHVSKFQFQSDLLLPGRSNHSTIRLAARAIVETILNNPAHPAHALVKRELARLLMAPNGPTTLRELGRRAREVTQ